jgi:PAS domain S-box-containing protein
MTSTTTTSDQTLRRHAEEKFRAKGGPPATNLSLEETRLFYELQVHQIELEMQNEELRSAKNELEALYARYFDLYDLAPLSYFTISDEGVILEANLTAATLLGVNRGGLVNQPFNRFIHKEDRKIFDLYSKLNVESGEPQTYELRMMKMDGTPIWAHLTATTGQNPTMEFGQDSACATVFRIVLLDITLQKKAEKEYREIEEQHRAAVQTTMDGYWLMDLQGRLLEVNDKYCLISGYSRQELLSMCTPDLEVAESAAEIASRIQTIMEKGKHKYEARYRNKDGSIIDVEVSAQHLLMDGGRIVAFLSNATERKRIEQKLKTSELEFRQLAESMPQIVWTRSPDGTNTYLNQLWLNYTGLTLEESYAEDWNKPFHPDDRQKARDAWQHAVRNGAEFAFECRLRRSDGVYTWWLIRGVPAKDEHGVIIKWFGTCTDIEELKQIE